MLRSHAWKAHRAKQPEPGHLKPTTDSCQRAPASACRGGVVLRNLDLDQTGFREALLVDGPFSVQPLIAGCAIRCSGDDAINTAGAGACSWAGLSAAAAGGRSSTAVAPLSPLNRPPTTCLPAARPPAAAPTFLRCTLTAKKVGLKAYGSSAPVLQACAIEQCGEQGLRAQEAAAPALHG